MTSCYNYISNGTFSSHKRECSVPWSPKLMEAQQRLRFWKYWLSDKRAKRDFSQARKKVWPEGSKAFRDPNWATIQEELRAAQKAVVQVLSKASESRSEHLEERAKMAEREGKGLAAAIVKRIIKAEHLRTTHRKIDTLLGKNNRSGLTFLLVTDGTVRNVFNRDEINELLIK
jgi:response regulator RpfG family c-di-GMP phosphodiesterase